MPLRIPFLKLKPFQQDVFNSITVVSGLPRSGTSLMMKMLEAGGMELLIDNIRKPDKDNPKGYYEFERVKQLDKGDIEWLADAQGKVVKIIATLLPYLPDIFEYRILFMRRKMTEILASQRKMLLHRGTDPDNITDEQMSQVFEKHIRKVEEWLSARSNILRLDVDYNKLLVNPFPVIDQVNQFLSKELDFEQMLEIIDPNLYRQRSQ
ncbi:MAG: sulfotransferase family protein [Anaerolineales bacterium]|nr:sulfotransferase family protein [Anaerolineales bacterium]